MGLTPGAMYSRRSARPRWYTVAGVLLLVLVFAFDMAYGDVLLLPLLYIPVVVATAALAGPRATAGIAVSAFALALIAGVVNRDAGSSEYWLRLMVLLAVVGIAFYLSGALAERELRYRMLAENASDFVTQASRDGLLEWVSPSVTTSLGYQPEDIIGRGLVEFVHPDDLTAFQESVDALWAEGVAFSRLRIRSSDGSYRWWSRNVHTQRGSGSASGVRVSGWHDVTSEVEALHELEESQQRYRLLAENASDVVLLWGADGHLDWVSPSVESVLGWSPEELIGCTASALLGEREANVRSKQVKSLQSGEMKRGRTEAQFVRADGGRRWMAVTGRALFDDGGTLIGVVEGLRDIQAEREARDELVALEKRFQLVAENASALVFRGGRNCELEWVSPSAKAETGWLPADLIGRRLDEIVHPDDYENVLAAGRLLRGGEPATCRARVRSHDGTYHWIESSVRPVLDGKGLMIGWIGSGHNADVEILVEADLERRAMTDDLTGFLTRTETLARLEELGRHSRHPGQACAIAFCDIDDFKAINDRWGHEAGDIVLSVIAARIRSEIRSGDLAGRMGGDEFLIVLDGVHDLEEALAIAEKVRRRVAEPIEVPDGTVEASLSIGVVLTGSGEESSSAVHAADLALYEAKRAGRNQVVTARRG